MKYPVVIEPATATTAFGVVVPDLPGCFSAGDTIEEALDNAHEAIELWIESVLDDGGAVPVPTSIDAWRKRREFKGWIWALVAIDLSTLEGKAERVNITLPSRVLRRIDAKAAERGETRSGFLANAALASIAR